MCSRSCACSIGLTISGFIAIILAGLFLGGVLTEITAGIYIALAISVAAILYMIVSLSSCCSAHLECFRNNGICLLIGAIGTIISAIIALSITLTPGDILGTILVGLIAFFFTLTIASIISLIICLLNTDVSDTNNNNNNNNNNSNNNNNNNNNRRCRCNRN